MNRLMSFAIGLCCVFVFVERNARAQEADALARIKPDVGKWTAELKMWPQGEDGDPVVFEASETNELLGENWILSNFEGEFGGQAFKGHGVYGFDAKKNCFVATWVDSVNGFMSQYEGKIDADSGSLVLFGKEIDPASGELVDGKQVRLAAGNDKRTIISFQKPSGAEEFVKVMEMTLTRRK